MEAVRRTPGTVRSLLLIGHNPGLHELAVALAGDDDERLKAEFPTASLAEFTVAAPWGAVAAGGGRLVRFLSPRDLLDEAEPPR